jgi:hypothetical protein
MPKHQQRKITKLRKGRGPMLTPQKIFSHILDQGTMSRIASATSSDETQRLLDHLKEAGYYSPKDLTSLSQNLDKIQASVDGGKDKYNQDILLLLQTRVDNCKLTLAELKLGLSTISSDLMPTYEKLVSILRSLSGLNVNRKFPVCSKGQLYEVPC